MPIIRPVKDGRFFVTWLHPCHKKEVLAIETTSYERFWTKKDLKEVMYHENGGGYIISDLDRPVGYIAFKESEILNLVVSPIYRNTGLGTILLQRAIRKISDYQSEHGSPCHRLPSPVSMFVRDSNLAGHLFLKKNGFVSSCIHKAYFENCFNDTIEYVDAYRFVKEQK